MAARLFRFICVLGIVLTASHSAGPAEGALITSFQSAFQLTTPAAGWSYLWNSAGAIGVPANYTALVPSPTGVYTSDGTDTFPTTPPAGFINFGPVTAQQVPGGHPGLGKDDPGSGGIERYAIALYTLPVTEKVSILGGLIRNLNPNFGGSTDGVTVKVFINDDPQPVFTTETLAGTGSQALFETPLGNRNAGDRIYMAIGSKNTGSFDSFLLQYDITSVPEPTAICLAALVLCWVVSSTRRRGQQ